MQQEQLRSAGVHCEGRVEYRRLDLGEDAGGLGSIAISRNTPMDEACDAR